MHLVICIQQTCQHGIFIEVAGFQWLEINCLSAPQELGAFSAVVRDEVLKWLHDHQFIRWVADEKLPNVGKYEALPLGKAAASGNLTPEEALVVYKVWG